MCTNLWNAAYRDEALPLKWDHAVGTFPILESNYLASITSRKSISEYLVIARNRIELRLLQVNSQVTKPHERELLSRVVEVMTSLELRLIQEKADDGQLIYRLEP